jgi:hypothetical protein
VGLNNGVHRADVRLGAGRAAGTRSLSRVKGLGRLRSSCRVCGSRKASVVGVDAAADRRDVYLIRTGAGWQVGAGRFSAQPLARRTPVPLINGLRRPVYPASPRREQNQLTVTQA